MLRIRLTLSVCNLSQITVYYNNYSPIAKLCRSFNYFSCVVTIVQLSLPLWEKSIRSVALHMKYCAMCEFIIKFEHVEPRKFRENCITVKAKVSTSHKQYLSLSSVLRYTHKLRTQSNAKDVLQQKLSNNFNEKHNDKLKEKPVTEKQFTAQKYKRECCGIKEEKHEKKLQEMLTGPKNQLKWLVMDMFAEALTLRRPRMDCVVMQVSESHIFLNHSMATASQGGFNPENMFLFSRVTINTGHFNTLTFVVLISRVFLEGKKTLWNNCWGQFQSDLQSKPRLLLLFLIFCFFSDTLPFTITFH